MRTVGFPGSSDGKDSACNVGDQSSIPGLGRSPGEGNGNPLQYSCLENPWTEKLSGLQLMGSQRVRHNWANKYFDIVKCKTYYVLRAMWENWSTARYRSQKWLFKCKTEKLSIFGLSWKWSFLSKDQLLRALLPGHVKRRKVFPSLNSTLSPSSMIQKSLALYEMLIFF